MSTTRLKLCSFAGGHSLDSFLQPCLNTHVALLCSWHWPLCAPGAPCHHFLYTDLYWVTNWVLGIAMYAQAANMQSLL